MKKLYFFLASLFIGLCAFAQDKTATFNFGNPSDITVVGSSFNPNGGGSAIYGNNFQDKTNNQVNLNIVYGSGSPAKWFLQSGNYFIQFYCGNKMTFTSPTGTVIKKIEILGTNSSCSIAAGYEPTSDTGTVTFTDNEFVYTASEDASNEAILIGGGAQYTSFNFDKIVVTYGEPTTVEPGPGTDPDPSSDFTATYDFLSGTGLNPATTAATGSGTNISSKTFTASGASLFFYHNNASGDPKYTQSNTGYKYVSVSSRNTMTITVPEEYVIKKIEMLGDDKACTASYYKETLCPTIKEGAPGTITASTDPLGFIYTATLSEEEKGGNTVTFIASNGTIRFSILKVTYGEFSLPGETYPEALFLISGNDDDYSATALTSTEAGVYTATDVTFDADGFAIFNTDEEENGTSYGASADGVTLESGIATEIAENGVEYTTEAGVYDITVDLVQGTVTATKTSEAAPKTLYLLGDCGTSWTSKAPVELTLQADGTTFSCDNAYIIASDETEPYGYVYFCTTADGTGTTYGPAEPNAPFEQPTLARSSEGTTMVAGSENKFKAQAGIYTLNLDFTEAEAPVVTVPGVTVGVEEVLIDAANASVEYFNLHGVRVLEPSAGVYIRQQGDKISKVIVK